MADRNDQRPTVIAEGGDVHAVDERHGTGYADIVVLDTSRPTPAPDEGAAA